MLLYRPLIIDWLPAPPHPHPQPDPPPQPPLPHPLAPNLLPPPPPSPTLSLSPCLIVSTLTPFCLAFLPIMSPSLPISFSVPLLLLLSSRRRLSRIRARPFAQSPNPPLVLKPPCAQVLAVNTHAGEEKIKYKVRRPALITHPSSVRRLQPCLC